MSFIISLCRFQCLLRTHFLSYSMQKEWFCICRPTKPPRAAHTELSSILFTTVTISAMLSAPAYRHRKELLSVQPIRWSHSRGVRRGLRGRCRDYVMKIMLYSDHIRVLMCRVDEGRLCAYDDLLAKFLSALSAGLSEESIRLALLMLDADGIQSLLGAEEVANA